MNHLFVLYLFFCLLGISKTAFSQNSQVLLWTTIADIQEETLPLHLECIKNIDYDKKALSVHLVAKTDSPSSQKILSSWIDENGSLFKKVVLESQEGSLQTAVKEENPDFCLISLSNVLFAPYTIKELIAKNLNIIAPLCYLVPETKSRISSFVEEHDTTYNNLFFGAKKGTFQVADVRSIYLVKPEFLSLVHNKNEAHFVSNEKDFGVILTEGIHPTEILNLLPSWCNKISILQPHILSFTQSGAIFGPQEDIFSLIRFNRQAYRRYKVEGVGLLFVNPAEDPIKQILASGKSWKPHYHSLMKRFIKPGSNAIDIGAHAGTHTLWMAGLVGKEGSIFAFEQDKTLFSELRMNLMINQQLNVEGRLAVVGEKVQKNASGIWELPLDLFQLQNVSFMKIKAGKYILETLKGAQSTIERTKPAMILEYIDNASTRPMINMLQAWGYTVENIGTNDWVAYCINNHTSVQ